MSSIRQLKKHVNFIADELMIDTYTFGYLFPEKDQDEIAKLIADIIIFRKNTLWAINGTANESVEPIKNQFKNIRIKMEAEVKLIVDIMGKI